MVAALHEPSPIHSSFSKHMPLKHATSPETAIGQSPRPRLLNGIAVLTQVHPAVLSSCDESVPQAQKGLPVTTRYGLLHYAYLIRRTGTVIFFQPT